MPPSLNYLGLLGLTDAAKNFGEVTLFFDDLGLTYKEAISEFSVASDEIMMIAQIQQDEERVAVSVREKDCKTKETCNLGEHFVRLLTGTDE